MTTRKMNNITLNCVFLAGYIGLTACGGGGGGGSTDAATPRTPQTAVYDQFSSFDHTLYTQADDAGLKQQIVNDGDFQFIAQYVMSPNREYVAILADDRLYVADLEQANHWLVSQLNNSDGKVVSFEWSPDSEHLIYLADGEVLDRNELYQVNRDGTNGFRISGTIGSRTNLDIADARWSPDGQYVAYLVEDNGIAIGLNTHRFTEQPDRNSLRVSLPGGSFSDISGYAGPAYRWSPDSRLLAYRQDTTRADSYQLQRVQPDGGGHTTISVATAISYRLTDFKWSPDSRYIAYDYTHEAGSYHALLCYDTENPGNPGPSVTSSLRAIEYNWAHEAALLAVSSDQQSHNEARLFVYDAPHHNLTPITHGNATAEDVRGPHWSPDDTHIAYATASGLFVAASQTDEAARQIAGVDASAERVTQWSWSPDAEHIAFSVTSVIRRGLGSLYFVQANGATQPVELVADEISLIGFQQKWSADASRLLYISGGDLYRALMSDGSKQVISSDTQSIMFFSY